MLFIILKAFFDLYLKKKFFFEFVGYVGKPFDKKAKVNFKIYGAITGKLIITIHILPNISRIKGNQDMKFIQFIKYNVRNIFLQKSC